MTPGRWLAGITIGVLAGGGVGFGLMNLLDRSTSPSPQAVPTPPAEPATPAPSTPAAVEESAAAGGLEQVLVIVAPMTGGDTGTSFCLSYTGSYSGEQREAVLMMEEPAYRCADFLLGPEGKVWDAWQEQGPPVCAAGSRPAEVAFDEGSEWGGNPPLFTCLGGNSGA